jgi:MAGUK p55 subfamily member 2/6
LGNTGILKELTDRCSTSRNPFAKELSRLLRKPHVKALVETHDEIGELTIEQLSKPSNHAPSVEIFDYPANGMPGETIKMVGLRKNPNEPLGLTVEMDDNDQLVVARILAGGMIDRQGLLHPGDVILEVNGVPVTTPEELQSEISFAKENVTLKIGPNLDEEMKSARLTMAGGQVKNGRNLESGKKLTVSTCLCVCNFYFYYYSD